MSFNINSNHKKARGVTKDTAAMAVIILQIYVTILNLLNLIIFKL